jgi:hypothetical protein
MTFDNSWTAPDSNGAVPSEHVVGDEQVASTRRSLASLVAAATVTVALAGVGAAWSRDPVASRPYRFPPPRDPANAGGAELVFDPEVRGRRMGGVAALRAWGLPVVVAGALAAVAGPGAGLGGLLASVAAVAWWHRSPRSGFVLTVDEGILRVFARGSKRAKVTLPLAELANVVLDTRTTHPVVEGASAIPAMRLIDSRVAPEVDIARIALVDGAGGTFLLGDDYLAHMEAVEWFGKVRTFLRKQSWLPESEREELMREG